MKYYGALSQYQSEGIFLPKTSRDLSHATGVLEFRVLSPSFYSAFVKDAQPNKVFDAELFCSNEEGRTIWVSDPDLLRLVFQSWTGYKGHAVGGLEESRMNRVERWKWSALLILRGPTENECEVQNYNETYPRPQNETGRKKRSLAFSMMDLAVLRRCQPKQANNYRRAVTRVLLAERITFGITSMLDLADAVARLYLAWSAASTLLKVFAPVLKSGMASWRELFLPNADADANALRNTLLCNSLHIWAYAKTLL